MNEIDISTIEELAEFMEAEATLCRRHDSEQPYVNGAGIRKQWHERINFPYAVCYMVGGNADENDIAGDLFPRVAGTPEVISEMKAMYFDIDGNKTDRPCGNETHYTVMNEEQKLAQRTLDLLLWYDSGHLFTQDKPGCTRDHIEKILKEVASGEVTGSKAHRFIGWAQGVLCMEGFISLDDARNVNRKVIKELNGEQ